MRQVVEYAEITTLVNLGRVGEARQRLEQKQGEVPEGDYLRLQHWVRSCTCAWPRASTGSRRELHERASTALGITGAGGLLGPAAWAHSHRRHRPGVAPAAEVSIAGRPAPRARAAAAVGLDSNRDASYRSPNSTRRAGSASRTSRARSWWLTC